MATTEDLTTLVCLFHHRDQASAATDALYKQGVPAGSISVIQNHGSDEAAATSLEELGIPARDRQHLLDGLRQGGYLVAVAAISDHVSVVENIFCDHRATKIDEAAVEPAEAVAPVAAVPDDQMAIPIVKEELAVGKRTVDQGRVRVYRRVVEIPVEESVNLREEHVVIERHAVDRPVTDADLHLQGEQTIELIETAEEAVVGKTAHVVEEVVIGKTTSERTEHIRDTLRHTEVKVEEVLPETDPIAVQRTL